MTKHELVDGIRFVELSLSTYILNESIPLSSNVRDIFVNIIFRINDGAMAKVREILESNDTPSLLDTISAKIWETRELGK
jgi:hypothetical protein